MADNTEKPVEEGAIFSILTQYVKDFSFENPNAPQSLRPRDKAPAIDININVNTNPLGEDNYEVLLSIATKAGEGADLMFHAELIYGGIFLLKNVPQEHVMPLLFIESPRLLFPFARQIIADATRNGGFPPLMIDPVDFAGLFQQRVEAEQNKAANQNA
ncbi:protein-export chaperone SecB [Bartonella sp. DGB2]|uniref:protein-export chaperone SecB n=1 Tax=Bartonella sp. DGB2 TaxID=3388426 RepID=UPI0039900189